MEQKKLYKSTTNKMLAGVCGGIGEYLNVDPTAIRVIWAIIACCGGVGLAAYIICALIMPTEPAGYIDM